VRGRVPIFIVATQVDRPKNKQQVDAARALQLCKQRACTFHQVSAATGSGVHDLFFDVVRMFRAKTAAENSSVLFGATLEELLLQEQSQVPKLVIHITTFLEASCIRSRLCFSC
jgi:hypothetical protein